MKIDGWDLFGMLCAFALIGFGIHGVVNRKRINNLGDFIISVGQIAAGIFALIVTIFLGMK